MYVMFRLNVSILSQLPIITHLGLKATAKDNLMKQRDQNHFLSIFALIYSQAINYYTKIQSYRLSWYIDGR